MKENFEYYAPALLLILGAALFGFYGIPHICGKLIQSTTPSKSPPISYLEIPILKTYFNFEEPTNTQIQKPSLSKLIQKKQPKISQTIAKEIATAVEKYATKYQFPPELIICLIERESSFNPVAISKANCKGLMQINGKFHTEELKKLNIKGDELFRIDNNVHIGTMILREYYDKTGSISGALKKYLGANNKAYMLDILTSFTDLMIKQK